MRSKQGKFVPKFQIVEITCWAHVIMPKEESNNDVRSISTPRVTTLIDAFVIKSELTQFYRIFLTMKHIYHIQMAQLTEVINTRVILLNLVARLTQ